MTGSMPPDYRVVVTTPRAFSIYKFIIDGDGLIIGDIKYENCLAIVVARDASEARTVAKDFYKNHKDPFASRPIDYMWIDYVEPIVFPVDEARCVGVTLG